jgi:tetratricopeptide (TPR) repeat protein
MKLFIIILLFPFQFLFSQSNYEKGEKLLEQKKYLLAKPFFVEAIQQNPKNFDAIDKLGEISIHLKEWDEAIKCGNKLKTAFPKNADYWYKYGGALGLKAKNSNKFKALGMLDDIEEAFETAAKLDPKHIGVRWAMVMYYIELPAIVGGSEAKSQKYANELITISKVDGFLAKGHIDSYFKRYEKAEAHYKKAHEIGNSNTTFEKLYDLYLNKLKDKVKAQKLKAEFK